MPLDVTAGVPTLKPLVSEGDNGSFIRIEMNKTFSFSVSINGVLAGEGSGRTKKEAEQMAAMKALEALTK